MARRAAALAALCAAAAAASPCNGDADCHMAGRCVAGACQCEKGWGGADCGRLALGVSYPCGAGGLCMHGELDNKATWGANAVQGDDGRWHMYAAMFPNASLPAWRTDTRVAHAVADRPQGPYTGADVALGKRGPAGDSYWDSIMQINPVAQRAPDGTWLLYYTGASISNATSDLDCRSSPAADPTCMQRVGLATAPAPEGPWARRGAPIVNPGPAGSWDDLFTTNPTPYIYPNGSALLLYKARAIEDQGVMSTGVAFAEHWSGPYERRGGKIQNLSKICEDAGIYRSPSMGVFRILFHCGCTYRYMWSLNGLDWHGTTPEIPWCSFTFSDGTNGTVTRRERPQFVLGKDGHPTHLLNAVQPTQPTDPVRGTLSWTLATELH
eukprot:TRINITY_DN538_c0_g4_i1.p1 TRINITY_DN538_c0_g4~~TRINITY_DN538_c0_g4_i1.p1  ORF type:complete len:404 (+),score=130.29 TRINITY_DN538_c0_g4_i1:67-1212(+)